MLATSLMFSGGCTRSSGAPPQRSEAHERARYEETRATINTLALELMRANEVTGLSLALVDEGEIVWATGWGWADSEKRLAAGPRTVYQVGSLTKPITAAAVLQAVERDELDLEAPLTTLLPELDLAGNAEQQITLGDLLAHRSGLPSDWFVHELSDAPPDWTEIVDELRELEPVTAPDQLTIYSNVGMTLAGLALARASGRSYEEQVSEALLQPAGMRTAHFARGPEPQPVLLPLSDSPRGLDAIELAAAYQRHEPRRDPEFRWVPAGGLRASVVDLACFAALLLRGGKSSAGEQLLDADSIDAMLTPAPNLQLDLDHQFGYGMFLDHGDLDWVGRVAWHGGRIWYHHARLIVLPDHGLAVAVASNSLTAGRVVDKLAVETLIAALLDKHGIEAPAPPADEPPRPFDSPLADEFLVHHEGDYATGLGRATIELHEGALWSRARFGDAKLEPIDPHHARLERMPGGVLSFAKIGDHELLTMTRNGRTRRVGVRLPEPTPIPAAWQARAGAWTLVEREGEVVAIRNARIDIQDDRLVLEYLALLEAPPMPVVEVLLPIDDQRARIAGLARGQGSVIEARGEGPNERLWWAGREFQRANAR